MSIIHFKTATQTAYDNLITKDSGTLYFTTDTHHIYKGDVQYGSGIPLQDLGTVDLTSYNNDYVTYLSTLNTGWYTVELEDQIFIVSVQTDTGNNYKIITYSSSEDLEEFYFLF